MRKIISLFASALLLIAPAKAEIVTGGGIGGGTGGSPAGSTPQIQYNNGGSFGALPINPGSYGAANAAALQAISSGMMIDPRNYGATCAGTTWSGNNPVQIGSADDTAGIEVAEYMSLVTGGVVMIPDGCWVNNLQLMSGVTLQGQSWAPNYGFDQGIGAIGPTLALSPGSGYTDGTYLLQATGTTNCLPVSGSPCFNLGLSINTQSTTSITIGTGSKTFTTSISAGLSGGTPVLIFDNTTTSNGTAVNYMYGTVTSDVGTTLVVNVTQTGGSGTIATWSIRKPNTVTISGGSLTSYTVNQAGQGYSAGATIPVPSAAGAGTGGAVYGYVAPSAAPYAKPVMYIKNGATYGIDVHGAETVAMVGFEINGGATNGTGACAGDTLPSLGFGGKIWINQMSFKRCGKGISADNNGCYDYLVSENSDYSANNIGINGCFSDFLSQGDTFTSGSVGIQGSGGGFARISNDRFEYLSEGIVSTSTFPFVEWDIVNTQFDHFDTCAVDLGNSWNQVNMTGGALKAGGGAGSLTVTGTATDPNGSGAVELSVTSIWPYLHNGSTNTGGFTSTTLGTSSSTVTFGTGSKTFTTSTSFGLSVGASVRVFQTGTPNSWMYGTVTSDSGTTLVLNVTQNTGSGSNSAWNIVTPPTVVVSGVGGTTEANGTWPLMVYDGNNIVLLGSTFVHNWTSGGFGGVRGKDSDICMSGTPPNNKPNQLVLSGVGYYSSGALGQPIAPAYIIESTTAGGSNGDYIGIYGGSLIKAGTANVASNYTSYSIGVENWVNAPPTHYVRDALGVAKIDTNDSTFSIASTGQLGAGTTSPATGLAFDMTADALGAFGLPQWSTAGRPTIGAGKNGFGFNTDTNTYEFWNGSAWGGIGSGGITRVESAQNTNFSTGCAANTDYIYYVSGGITVTLCSGAGNTNTYTFVDTDGSSITLSGTINGTVNPKLNVVNQTMTINMQPTGTNYNIQ